MQLRDSRAVATEGGRDWGIGWGLGVFLLALAILGPLFQRLPVLYDTDSYYHLAISRAYARHGIIESLPWAQLSVLHEFADKEFLFHLLLAPVADTEQASAGGRWALAALNAAILGLLSMLGHRAVGRWGAMFAPLLVYVGSLDVLGRVIRLRPELLSLFLLLLALTLAGLRRYRSLGLVTLVYTLAYTAFHALVGFCGLFFLHQAWVRRRREWGLLLYPCLGAGLGLILHPHFPRNLVIWKIQSLDFFQLKDTLDVGTEIGSHSVPEMLGLNLVWGLALWVLGRAVWTDEQRNESLRGLADVFTFAFLVFGVLYLLMLRFSLYAIPFGTLAFFFQVGYRGNRLEPSLRLPWRGRFPVVVALTLVLGFGAWRTGRLLANLSNDEAAVSREEDWAAFGRSLPPGARVAASWGSTHLYMFWAPQATYLNVLDPIFMAVPFPEAHRSLQSILEDREPDIPRALQEDLLSDHIALSRFHQPSGVIERLRADPRVRTVYEGYTLLFQLAEEGQEAFLPNWRISPPGVPWPPAVEDIQRWPLLATPSEEGQPFLGGYVNFEEKLPPEGRCAAVAHELRTEEAGTRTFELAPYGPTRLWLDGRLVVEVEGNLGARLGRGLRLSLDLKGGAQSLAVVTCRSAEDGRGPGFYFRHLP